MSFLSNAISGAIGYGVSEISKSHPVRDYVDEHFGNGRGNRTLEDVIEEFARSQGIYTSRNDFAYHLHKIAERYEEYNYHNIY